ncbi:MAG: helix-turn-helix domain-containing protein [Candidatus Pacearchaeota archaeon]
MKETKETLSKEFIAKIKAAFGINEYEAKVWIALLMRGIASIGEIAELSGVPRSRVYDVLESLEKQGFVIMKLGKPIKYMALKPAEVIERLKANLMASAKEKIKIFDNIKSTEEYLLLEQLFNQGIKPINLDETTQLIKGRNNINYNLKTAIRGAKKSVIIVTNLVKLNDKIRLLKPLMPELNKAKVKILIAAKGDERAGKLLSKELGIKIRKIDFDSRFCIIDGKEIFLMPSEGTEPRNDFAIYIKSPFFASSLINLLNNYLNNSQNSKL